MLIEEPMLQPSQKRVVAVYHDETFHGNYYKRSAC